MCVCVCVCVCVRYSVVSSSVTPWTVALAYQAPLSMEFSRQEYRSGEPFLSPGDLSSLGIKLRSPPLQIDSLPSEPPGKAPSLCIPLQLFCYIFLFIYWVWAYKVETTKVNCKYVDCCGWLPYGPLPSPQLHGLQLLCFCADSGSIKTGEHCLRVRFKWYNLMATSTHPSHLTHAHHTF